MLFYNIDHLEAMLRENSRMQEPELSKCNEIITRHATAEIKGESATHRQAAANVEMVPGWALCEAAI